MRERELLAVADAVFDVERSLRRAADVIDDLSDLAASSLRVLDDAATDAFYAHQEERKEVYVESAEENLARLRGRSDEMNDLGGELSRHLTEASSAIERAGHELTSGADGEEHTVDVRTLRTQLEVLGEIVRLARPVADQLTHHAQQAAESAAATDAPMLLDARVRYVDQGVARSDEGVSMVRSVLESARSRARATAALAEPRAQAASQSTANPGNWGATSQHWPSPPPHSGGQSSRSRDPGIGF